jgi:hypothetical protein
MPGRTLAESSFSHLIRAPIELVDIAEWLAHLTSAEFRRCCPPAHIAAGCTTTDEGRPMAINVELIGDTLLVQHYVGEVLGPRHCRLVSTSDVLGPEGRTTCHVVWDLSVEPLDAESCEYVNHVIATATDEFTAHARRLGISLEEIAAAHQRDYLAHNEQETGLLASSIERRALASR